MYLKSFYCNINHTTSWSKEHQSSSILVDYSTDWLSFQKKWKQPAEKSWFTVSEVERLAHKLSMLSLSPSPCPHSLAFLCHSSESCHIIFITSHLLHVILMPTFLQALDKKRTNKDVISVLIFHQLTVVWVSFVAWQRDYPENVQIVS